MNEAFEKLKQRLATMVYLERVNSLLSWDEQTKMPRAGAAVRGEHRATLARLAHELLVSPETETLLNELASYEDALDPESDDASLIRFARYEFERKARVPAELEGDIRRLRSENFHVWAEAKARSDFERFRPALERMIELKRRYADCLDGRGEPYDVLLDEYERGMTADDVRRVFDTVKERLVPLIATVAARDDPALDECLRGDFAVDRQQDFCRRLVDRLGYRADSWRLDPTEHPFATHMVVDDIRITTNYAPDNLQSVFATIHEYGHGLYEHGVDPRLERTPLASGVSYGLHQSQSRPWENLVGRSLPFWRWLYPDLQRTFPEQLGAVDVEHFYRAVNRVHPSLIRIYADEVTYNMHVILRFELEQHIIAGRLEVRELPDVWNGRMSEYLGVDVPDDAHGVLQDVHWAEGYFGYFPTYSLGNVMSVQIWERVGEDVPDLDDRIERGDFTPLREWLRERLHRHGRKSTPAETLAKAVGGPLTADPYLRYLEQKHGALVAG